MKPRWPSVLKQITPAEQAFSTDDDNLNLHIVVKGGMDADKGVLRNVTIIHFAPEPTVVNDIRVAKDQPVWQVTRTGHGGKVYR